MIRIDARLPLRFAPLAARGPDEAVLTDRGITAAAPFARFTPGAADHPVDCACCAPRSGASVALAALFRARAVGRGTPFRGVLAVVGHAGEAAIRAALLDDPLAFARFRLAPRD